MFYKNLTVAAMAMVLIVTGWGCTENTINPVPTNTAGEKTNTTAPVKTTEEVAKVTPETSCPENMTRFWSTHKFGEGLTFCYYSTATDGQKIMINNFGDKVVLYPENNPQFNHSILLERLNNSSLVEETIATKYMTTTERTACSVVANQRDAAWTQYIIAGGDLEAQEKCGEFRYGSFFYSKDEPDFVFFVMIGQDTFMPSDAWLETLDVAEATTAQSQTVAPANNFINQFTTYQNKNLGLSFSYPADWGPMITDTEMGYQENEDFTKQPTCEVQQTLELAGLRSGLFLSAHNILGCGPAGRGGWFGDEAQKFTSWDKVTEWCENTGDDCEILTNKNNIKVAHSHTKTTEIWGETYQDLDLYALYNQNSDLPGIIISNERFISSGLGRSEKELRNLVDSIKFE